MTGDESSEDIPETVKKTGTAGFKAKTKFESKRKLNETPKTKAGTTKEKSNTNDKSSKGKDKAKVKPTEVEDEDSVESESSDESGGSDMSYEPKMKKTNKKNKGKKGKPHTPKKPAKPVFAPTPGNYKASHLKRALSFTELDDHEGRRAPSTFNKLTKADGERDPENHEIMRLRDDEHMSFGDIAQRLNEQRVARGRLPGLTENAIYSRYIRNAPLIAAAMGKEWSPVSLSKKPIGANITRPQPIKFAPEHDELLVRVYKEVVDETWETVKKRFEERGGPQFDTVTLARRFNML